ncbi:MAG TPA: AMP-binding protein, partial [Anaerolineaceae bacterium]|nr:AMP-binding protein [Anaerolineaceae bacterium]
MSDLYDSNVPIAWQPDSRYLESANLTHFMRRLRVGSYEELYQRSIEDVAWFTEEVLKYLDIRFSTPYKQVMDNSKGIPWTRWCVGGKMNIVDNCLDKNMGTPQENEPALGWEGEEGTVRWLTYRDLWRLVNQTANGLRALGARKGDVVGLFMPMVPETVAALLATAKIGGIILPLFSGYGSGAVATRLQDADARFLFTADGLSRRGKLVNLKLIADDAAAQSPNLEHVIIYNRLGLSIPMQPGRDHTWEDLVLSQPEVAESERTDADDPVMIIYTSGTTGRPKGTIHTHCGFPVKSTQDMAFGTDVHPGERVYWVTDMGWMMGPWLSFGSLLRRGTMILYDGAPDYPGPDRLWSLIERHRITTLGISPTLVRALIP